MGEFSRMFAISHYLKTVFWFIFVFVATAKSEDVLCSNLWSAMNTMQNGVDLVSFDLFGEHPGWSSLPILKYTCNKGIKWTNSINKIIYSVPDQFAQQPIAIPSDVTTTTSHQTMTTIDEKVWMSEEISQSYAFGMFSKTKTISASYQSILVNTRLWGQINSSVSAFRVNFIPYQIAPNLIQLSDNAATYIYSTIKNKGPIFNQSTINLYEQFFGYFGTHFFSSAYTGGAFHLRYETDKYLLYEMNAEQISEQGSASFFNLLVKDGAVSGGQKQIDARFSSMSTIIETCKGGSFCPTSQTDYDKWEISVASVPWILSANFIPMTVLIYNNSQLRNSFDEAIFNHFQVSYLKNEILSNIEHAKNKVGHGINETSTFNENISCQYPNYAKYIATKCDNYATDCEYGPACQNGKSCHWMFTSQNEYHSYVTDLESFHSNLVSIQSKILMDINVVQNNTNELLSSSIVSNQILFNVTANMWKRIVGVLESDVVWDVCRWVNVYDCVSFSPGHCSKAVCAQVQDSHAPCSPDVIFNVTYFQGMVGYNSIV